MQDSLIITVFQHATFGYQIQPMFAAYDNNTDIYTITEIASASSAGFTTLSDQEKKIVSLAERYNDRNLMKAYSREANEKEFIKKAEPTTIETYIRPFIEGKHKEILSLLRKNDIPIFLRKKLNVRHFASSSVIELLKESSQMILFFSNKEKFIYTIQIKNQNSTIKLSDKFFAILYSNPAQVIVGNQLHYFEDVDYKKLLPFTSRHYIEVPPQKIAEYMQKFVVPSVAKFNVETEGIYISEQKHAPQALLTLENGLDLQPVLTLKFKYGERIFKWDRAYKKEVEYINTNRIEWFYRDQEWEKESVNTLLAAGLEQTRTGQFALKKKGTKDPEGHRLIEWVNNNGKLLEQFIMGQAFGNLAYYTGEIGLKITSTKKTDWFDMECMVVFNDFSIPFTQFKNHILNNIREYILPDERIAILPDSWFTRFSELFRYGKTSKNSIRLKNYHYQLKELAETGSFPNETAEVKQAPISIPSSLNATLRPYQVVGFKWLAHLQMNNFGGCLSDDMGLGKTLQTITQLLNIYASSPAKTTRDKGQPIQLSLFDDPPQNYSMHDSHIAPTLIVMPVSLIHNWLNELNKFAPSLKVYIHTGNNRLTGKAFENMMNNNQVILTSYGIVRQDITFLDKHFFHYIILDESQYIKNPNSQTFKCIKQLNSKHKLILTGTPIENSLTDLWSQMDFINDGILGTLSEFKKTFDQDNIVQHEKHRNSLLEIITPFILRRTKEEVAPELPPLTQEIRYCEMSPEQAALYNEEKNRIRTELISQLKEDNKLNAIALSSLTRLRLLANHPQIVDEDYENESGKFREIIEQSEILFSEGHKVLIFSSFVKHLRLLAAYFEIRKWKYAWLSGSTKNREEVIEQFNSDNEIHCFFISLKAGGVGLNLTAANYVFIIDPWWNPAAENQAVSRAHRIGQNKKVTLYRFITKDTIEEKIVLLQNYKDALSDALIKPEFSKETIQKLLE